MLKVIGGLFGLHDAAPVGREDLPDFLKGERLLLANARSGIALLVQPHSPPQVWLPSYLCDCVVHACQTVKSLVRFYEVDYDLKIASDDWLEAVGRGDMVLFIHYFGFPAEPFFMEAARARGAWVLEDASQALLSGGVGLLGDYVLYSPRKWVGIPDGGVLVSKRGVPWAKLNPLPLPWWLKGLKASLHRRDFDHGGEGGEWYALYAEAEAEASCAPCAMSELSAALLHHCIDYSEISHQRRENYKRLAAQLPNLAWMPELPVGVVPLGFPIRLRDRDRVKFALASQNIYPPVHWAIRGVVPECFGGSHRLSAEMMTLPCDQRLGGSDMDRIANAVMRAV